MELAIALAVIGTFALITNYIISHPRQNVH